MNNELHIDKAGEKLIHSFEGCRLKAYYDPIGVLTIGWGHTNAVQPSFSPAAVWTQKFADEVFRKDIIKYEDAIKRNVKTPLTQGQFNALSSLVYNIGEGNFKKSQLLNKLNQGQYEAASREFAKWNKAGGRVLPGLTRRRAAEALMFQSTSQSVAPQKNEPPVQQVDEPTPETNPITSKTVATSATVATAGGTIALDQVAEHAKNVENISDSAKHIGIIDHIMNLPSLFWVGLGIILCAGLIIYFRIKDHS